MTRRQRIDTSREIRQWIGIVTSALTTVALVKPELLKDAGDKVVDTYHKGKDKIREKYNEWKAEREIKKQ